MLTSIDMVRCCIDHRGNVTSASRVIVLLPYSTEITERIKHLDLSTYVEFRETKVVCAGAYGDVSKIRCTLPNLGSGKTKVAVKRLRFYMKEDIATVRIYMLRCWRPKLMCALVI